MGLAIFAGVCIVFDIITGLIKAIYTGDLNSTALRKGLLHKTTEIITLVGAALAQFGIENLKLTFDIPVFVPIAVYIGVMEIVSVIENISIVNPQMAKALKPYLAKLKEREDKNDGSSEGN